MSSRRLIGTVTDGDVRRALLAGEQLDTTTALQLLERKSPAAPQPPLTAPVGTSRAELLELLNRHDLRHIPLVDAEGRVAGIELLSRSRSRLRAADSRAGDGGRVRDAAAAAHRRSARSRCCRSAVGRCSSSLSISCRQAGIRRVNVATHYRADVIEQHFGDGRDFGVEISYVNEDQPLGTAGRARAARRIQRAAPGHERRHPDARQRRRDARLPSRPGRRHDRRRAALRVPGALTAC